MLSANFRLNYQCENLLKTLESSRLMLYWACGASCGCNKHPSFIVRIYSIKESIWRSIYSRGGKSICIPLWYLNGNKENAGVFGKKKNNPKHKNLQNFCCDPLSSVMYDIWQSSNRCVKLNKWGCILHLLRGLEAEPKAKCANVLVWNISIIQKEDR